MKTVYTWLYVRSGLITSVALLGIINKLFCLKVLNFTKRWTAGRFSLQTRRFFILLFMQDSIVVLVRWQLDSKTEKSYIGYFPGRGALTK